MIAVSIALGVIWNFIAVYLMGGRFFDAFTPSFLLAGALTGGAAGVFTIWSRQRKNGRESLFYGVVNYYLAILLYWMSFVFFERAIMCAQYGGWTSFDLDDHLKMIFIFLWFGTVPFGIILIPLTFLSRHLIWSIYKRSAV